MTPEEHKAAIRRIFEGHRKRNLDAIDELFAEDFVNHSPMIGCAPDREGLKDSFLRSFEAFPDIQYTLNDQIAEGDKVVTHFTMTGTHNGPFLGNQPTGNTFEVSSITEPPEPIVAQKLRGEIEFCDVTYGYKPDEPVLKNVSFRLSA